MTDERHAAARSYASKLGRRDKDSFASGEHQPAADSSAVPECHICHRPLNEPGEWYCSSGWHPREPSAAYDRRVHAISAQGREIVRYERAGKWYEEWPDGFRERIDIKEAVMRAFTYAHDGGELYLRVPGGTRFDYLVGQL